MARIWMSGLEAGHLDIFDSCYEAEVSAAQARTGSYSLRVGTYYDAYARAALPAAVAEIFVRFGFRSTFGGGDTILSLQDDAGNAQCYLALNRNTHTIDVRRGDYNDTILGRDGEIHQNRWHCIEFRLKVDNTTGVLQLKVDGTLVIDFSGDTQASANANVKSFSFGDSPHGGSASLHCYYDDIAFNNVADGVNDSWIGRGGIPTIFPTGAGASTDLGLVPDEGEANWEDVDEVPPDDDTSYVFDAVIDEHDSYTAGDLPATGTILAVQWVARARSDLAGDPKIARILRVGGVDHQGADKSIDVSYDYYTDVLDEDPEAAGAWLVAAVNGMEVGVKVR